MDVDGFFHAYPVKALSGADDKTVQHDNTILDLGSKYGVANIAVSHRDTIDCRHIDEFLTVGRDQPQVDCR